MLRRVWVLATVFFLCSLPAYSSDFTLFGGVQRQSKLTLKSAVAGASAFPFDPKNFGVMGVRVGGGRVFASEQTIAYSPNFIDSQSKAIILGSNVLIQAPMKAVKPYVTAGLGVIRSSGSGPSNIGTKAALNYGAGLKLKIAGSAGLRFDARGYKIPKVQGQTLRVLEVTVGVIFQH